MADKNFAVKWTFTEATDVQEALEEKFERLTAPGVHAMSTSDKIVATRLQAILARDFDVNVR